MYTWLFDIQVIAELVQRRRQVKGFMASERDPVSSQLISPSVHNIDNLLILREFILAPLLDSFCCGSSSSSFYCQQECIPVERVV